jgi:hypothetical protein
MDADDRFAHVTKCVKTVVAQFQAELILAPGSKTAVAFVAGGVLRPLTLFLDVNFGMNFKSDHNSSPRCGEALQMPKPCQVQRCRGEG